MEQLVFRILEKEKIYNFSRYVKGSIDKFLYFFREKRTDFLKYRILYIF